MSSRDLFDVAVEPQRLDSATGPASGPLAVRVEDLWFPEKQWSDFPVVVLGWWLRECAAVASGGPGVFRFMDGPYRYRVGPERNGRAVIQCFRNEVEEHEATVPVTAVLQSVGRAAQAILAECDRRRLDDRDVHELRAWLGAPSTGFRETDRKRKH